MRSVYIYRMKEEKTIFKRGSIHAKGLKIVFSSVILYIYTERI